MKISARGRYALLALTYLAHNYLNESYISAQEISREFSISKIYLEQILSILKKEDLVFSTKGPLGGYRLHQPPKDITVLDILKPIETAWFEGTEKTLQTPSIYEEAFSKLVYEPIDQAIQTSLSSITLEDLATSLHKDYYMYYI